MSDGIRAWLDHTQRLGREAFGGPWSCELDDAERLTMKTHGDVPFTLIEREEFRGSIEDAEWIAHARTALPQATAAIRAVLDLHKPPTSGTCPECSVAHLRTTCRIAHATGAEKSGPAQPCRPSSPRSATTRRGEHTRVATGPHPRPVRDPPMPGLR